VNTKNAGYVNLNFSRLSAISANFEISLNNSSSQESKYFYFVEQTRIPKETIHLNLLRKPTEEFLGYF
jgi:hypothetical protein